MDPEPNEETKVSAPTSAESSVRQGGVSDDPTAPEGEAVDAVEATDGGDPADDATTPERAPAPAPAPATPAKPAAKAPAKPSRSRPKAGTHPNNVRRLRQRAMMSKAELARRAGVSPLTIDRVESGCPCRMDTKRKILEALGIQPASAAEVFPDVDLG